MKTSNFLEEVRRLCRLSNLNPDKFGDNLRFEKVPANLNSTPVNLNEIRGFRKPFVKELEYLGQIARNLLSQIEDDRENQKINDISKNIIDYMNLILQIETMVIKTRRKFVVHNGFVYEEKLKG
jgi:hypothetical protein